MGTPRAIRSDNGKEYISKSFRSFCISNRIKREHTAPYSPHQNGVSERRWRTTVEMARCMLKTAKLGNEFRVRALHTAFYISNRCLTVSLPKGKTPFEMFFGKKPDLSNLKVFGCTAFKHIETHQDKLSDKATKEVLLVILRIPKHTFCTILILKRLRFLATSPLMRLLLTFLLRTQVKTSEHL